MPQWHVNPRQLQRTCHLERSVAESKDLRLLFRPRPRTQMHHVRFGGDPTGIRGGNGSASARLNRSLRDLARMYQLNATMPNTTSDSTSLGWQRRG
jgi:hypothetical protein